MAHGVFLMDGVEFQVMLACNNKTLSKTRY